MATTKVFFDGVSDRYKKINQPMAIFKRNIQDGINKAEQGIDKKLSASSISRLTRISLTAAKGALTATSTAVDLFVPGSMDHVAGDFVATATGMKAMQMLSKGYKGSKVGGAAVAGATKKAVPTVTKGAEKLVPRAIRGSAAVRDMAVTGAVGLGAGIGLTVASQQQAKTKVHANNTNAHSDRREDNELGNVNNSRILRAWSKFTSKNSTDLSIQTGTSTMHRSTDKPKVDNSFIREIMSNPPITTPPPPDDEETFDRMIRCGRYGKFSRIKGTNYWATIDRGVFSGNPHGEVYWKIYKQINGQLVHQYEADEFFNIINKNKGDVGKVINPKKQCYGVLGRKGL